MATRIKTVHYSLPMFTTATTNAVDTALGTGTIYIPETVTSGSFVSVTAEVGFQDIITATGGTISEFRFGIKLGAAASTNVYTDVDGIANTGENIAGIFGPFNLLSYFQANWSGTSMAVTSNVYFNQSTGTTLGMRNITVIYHITYTYDDTNATQLKTAAIPLESPVGALPTTANSNFGTSQIPILTGLSGTLPEGNVTIRDYYFVIEGNESTAGSATDFTVSANIDSGTATAFGIQEAALATDRFVRWIYKPGAVPLTTSTHQFQLWATTARVNHVVVTLYVTYQFTLAATTKVLSSILLPLEIGSPLSGASSTANRYSRELLINDPGTLTLKQSAFRINYNAIDPPTGLSFRMGPQAYRTYTPAVLASAGMYNLQQRIDSGGSQGAGFTLARGKNTFVVDGYFTATQPPFNITGYILLNYISDLSPLGIGAHAHTVDVGLRNFDIGNTLVSSVNGVITIPESSYRIMSAGFQMTIGTPALTMAIGLDVMCLSTEGKGGGYYDIYTDAYRAESEWGTTLVYAQGRDVVKRYPDDPGADRIDMTAIHTYRYLSSSGTSAGISFLYTYHALSVAVSGTISGSTGGTVTINVYRSDNRELIYTTTRTGNGSYGFDWYDNTIAIYAEAYESSTKFGRSSNVIPGAASLDVNIGGSSSSVQVVARAYTG